MSAWWFVAASAFGAAGVLALSARRPDSARRIDPSISLPRPGTLAVLDATTLLARTRTLPLATRIAELSGFDRANWTASGNPLLERYAEFVQRLPASESHHHAHPGGLLTHGLECAALALEARHGRMLPPGASAEAINGGRHRWSYAVLVAALLHDIAKPLADLEITLIGADGTERRWQPLAGPMAECAAARYVVDFRDPGARDYGAHQRLAVLLMQRLVPQPALAWLADDAGVMEALAGYLSGAERGPLAELVTDADRESVRRNLLSGPRTRFAGARAVPLTERIMQALRRLLDDRSALPLNRKGAVGWVYDGSLWIAAKTCAGQVRGCLDAHEQRLDGAAGIPADNTRLFDTWQEYAALVPNPATGLSVWNVIVHGADGTALHRGVLQVLRFPLDRLYADPARYPAPFDGHVEAVQRAAPTDSAESVAQDQPSSGASDRLSPATSAAVALLDAHPCSAPHGEALQADALTIVARELQVTLAPLVEADTLDAGDSAAAAAADAGPPVDTVPRMRLLVRPGNDGPLRPKLARDEPLAPALPKLPPLPGDAAPKEATPLAHLFMHWIAGGVADGSLAYNTANSMVHFVSEGLLLVSPKVFRHFEALVQSGTVEDTDGLLQGITWNAAQNALAKSGWLYAAQPGNRHAVTYDVLVQGKEVRSTVTGFLVQEPIRWLSPLPRPNPYLLARSAQPAKAHA